MRYVKWKSNAGTAGIFLLGNVFFFQIEAIVLIDLHYNILYNHKWYNLDFYNLNERVQNFKILYYSVVAALGNEY